MLLRKAGFILRATLMLVAALALGLSSGCASNTDADIGATFDPLTAFPANAVWTWDEARNKIPQDTRLNRAVIDQNIKSAVAAEFAARGYSETSADKVHYVLSYELGIHTWMSQTETRAFGSLSLLLTEAASARKVWLGFVRMQIDMSLTPTQRNERLRVSLARLLESFPPAQPK